MASPPLPRNLFRVLLDAFVGTSLASFGCYLGVTAQPCLLTKMTYYLVYHSNQKDKSKIVLISHEVQQAHLASLSGWIIGVFR